MNSEKPGKVLPFLINIKHKKIINYLYFTHTHHRVLGLLGALQLLLSTETIIDKKVIGKADEIQKFEIDLPFDNISIGGFFEIIQDLEKEGAITIEQLQDKLSTNEFWADALKSPDTTTSRLLTSDYFRDGSAINVENLVSFALLHCANEKGASAKVFYKVVQAGGSTVQSWIAAEDKDFEPAFERMCLLATEKIVQFYSAYGSGEERYDGKEYARIRDAIEQVREEWLDVVFGVDSKMDAVEWIKKVDSDEARWIFDADILRKKLFKAASLNWRY